MFNVFKHLCTIHLSIRESFINPKLLRPSKINIRKCILNCQSTFTCCLFNNLSYDGFFFFHIVRNKNIQPKMGIVFSKVKFMFWSSEDIEGVSSLILVSSRFEFKSVIFYIFYSFLVSFIYYWLFLVVLRLENFLTLFVVISGLM